MSPMCWGDLPACPGDSAGPSPDWSAHHRAMAPTPRGAPASPAGVWPRPGVPAAVCGCGPAPVAPISCAPIAPALVCRSWGIRSMALTAQPGLRRNGSTCMLQPWPSAIPSPASVCGCGLPCRLHARPNEASLRPASGPLRRDSPCKRESDTGCGGGACGATPAQTPAPATPLRPD